MQNNESNPMFRFFKHKGYYMLLGLCLAALGVTGYVFVSDAVREQQSVEQTSVPVTAETPQAIVPVQEAPREEALPEQSQVDAEPQPETQQVMEEMEETVMPVSGELLRDYAMDHLTFHDTTRDWRVHNGVDLAAPLGQPVQAARDGTVSAVYDDPYYGRTVVVQHSGGYSTHYAALSQQTSVEVGDTVTAGQPLGSVGDTALIEAAEAPHLHFEVYLDGVSVDPAGFLY